MTVSEQAFYFGPPQRQLLGILTVPDHSSDTGCETGTVTGVGVVIVVGGPQYRVGSHRQFVLLARSVAAAGYPVLRFDVAGMGDSEGESQDFQNITPDIAAALDALQQHQPDVQHMVLWGLCDGASAALLYLHATHDARLSGLCLLNPWVRSATTLARTQLKHYYRQRLLQKDFWLKLLHAQVGARSLFDVLNTVRLSVMRQASNTPTTYQQQMALAWQHFAGPLLLVLSGQDLVAHEFLELTRRDPDWSKAWAHPRLRYAQLAQANHTFSNQQARQTVTQLTLDWLQHQVMNRAPAHSHSAPPSTYSTGLPCPLS